MISYIEHSAGGYRLGETNGDPIFLNSPSKISLNINQQSILKITRIGDDLVVYLADGQQVLIVDFFFTDSGAQQHQLFTSTSGEIQEVELGERYGVFATAEYRPLETFDNGLLFNEVVENSSPSQADFSTSGGFGNLGIVAGGIAGVGLLGALAGNGNSNEGISTSVQAPFAEESQTSQRVVTAGVVDTLPPSAPVIQIASGTQISGTGEPGAIVDIDTNGNGVVDLSTTVAANGAWLIVLNPTLTDGTLVTARQTDAAGNQSVVTADTVDALPPSAPFIQTASGAQISGTGEPGAIVDLDTNGDGVVDLSTTVAANGEWIVAPNPALTNGTLVTVRQTDSAGNQSIATSDTIDALAPIVPYVDISSDGTQIIGTAEQNSAVSVSYVGAGDQIVSLNPIAVSATGSWDTVPNPTLATNEDIYVSAVDASGNQSAHTLVLQGADDGVLNFDSLSGDAAIGIAAFDIESIDLSDNVANALIISEANLQALSAGSDTLRIDGVAGNEVTASGASANGNATINGQLYNVFEFAGGSQLTVDPDVLVVL